MSDLAPLAIGTYTRLKHLKATIESLKNNLLAKSTDLYVFSDAAQEGDECAVMETRKYLETISGFKSVTIWNRKVNGRIPNNRGGMKTLLEKYGKLIFLEDDNIAAPGFLTFMNNSLNLYRDNPKVLSICGYTPSIDIYPGYSKEVIALNRVMGFSIGLWKESFDKLNYITMNEYHYFLRDNDARINLQMNYGDLFIDHIRREAFGEHDGLDLKGTFYLSKKDEFCVHPTISLIHNIGCDGSGLHCLKTETFDTFIPKEFTEVKLDKHIQIDYKILNSYIRFMNSNSKDIGLIVDNLIEQLVDKKISEFSLWGLGCMSDLFLLRSADKNWKINFIIDSKAKRYKGFKSSHIEKNIKAPISDIYYVKEEYFTPDTERKKYFGRELVTIEQALCKGEKNIVLMSFSSRSEMSDIAKSIDSDCEVIQFNSLYWHSSYLDTCV